MLTHVLRLDAAGTPLDWISLERAAGYVAKDLVLWEFGSNKRTLHGGHNEHGVQTTMTLPSIMAIKGKCLDWDTLGTVSLSRDLVFKRDRCMCAYCGQTFKPEDLELEHVIPESRGGPTSWTNIVSADRACNARKADKTPEEARMPLLYVPYVPNRYEGILMQGRRILADQMEYLAAGLPPHSRLRM